jgi:hypothetical protein
VISGRPDNLLLTQYLNYYRRLSSNGSASGGGGSGSVAGQAQADSELVAKLGSMHMKPKGTWASVKQ